LSLINKWGINGKGSVIVKIRNLINELVKILNTTKGYLALTIGQLARVEGEANYIDRLISSKTAIQENYEILDSFPIDYEEEND